MKTEKYNLWERLHRWFIVSRVIVTFWNMLAFCYHYFFIGINFWTSILIQIIALTIEYTICGWYENMLIWSNNKINNKTRHLAFYQTIIIRLLGKFIVYTILFALIYDTSYYLRLEFFHLIGWHLNFQQFSESIYNMILITPIYGPIMGSIVIARKKKKRNAPFLNRHRDRVKLGSSV